MDALLYLILGPVSIQLLQDCFKLSLVRSSKLWDFLRIVWPQNIVMVKEVGEVGGGGSVVEGPCW